jgi:hypothetical protein
MVGHGSRVTTRVGPCATHLRLQKIKTCRDTDRLSATVCYPPVKVCLPCAWWPRKRFCTWSCASPRQTSLFTNSRCFVLISANGAAKEGYFKSDRSFGLLLSHQDSRRVLSTSKPRDTFHRMMCFWESANFSRTPCSFCTKDSFFSTIFNVRYDEVTVAMALVLVCSKGSSGHWA